MNITKRLITLCLGLILCCFGSCSKKNEQGGSVTSFSGSFVNRGRPAADLANYRIAYYEPADGESDFAGGVIQESDDPFIITDFGPRDILPKEIIKPSIYVNFSQPVVPLAKLGEPIREGAGLFTIEPPLAGVYRWYGSRLLSFEPAADIPQQRYTITVSDRITSLGGKSLEGERSFNFETDRLSVLEWRLGQEDRWVTTGNADPDDARHIRLIFSHPVNLAEIARWIEIWAGGRTWPFTLERLQNIDERRYRAEQGVLITIKDKFPLNTEVVMELKEGACSEPGWLGTLETMAWTYHTLLPFRFENISVNSYSRPRTGEGDYISISLEFSQPVEPDGAERSFSVDGFSALRKDNVNVYGSTVVINRLPLAHQQRYTVRIAAGLKDLYGRVLGRSEQVEAQTGEAESYVYFLNRGPRMLEAGFPANIIWEMQNPVALSSRIDAAQGPYERLPPSGMTAMNLSRFSPNTKRHFMEDLSPFLNAAGKGTATMRWDYKTKSSWQRGIVYSGDTWLTVQVTNIGITVRYAHNMVLVWATHLSDGTPAADTVVELLESERIILSGVTDAQGLAVFEFPGSSIASRFTEPYSSVWDTETTGKGLRIRVTEGQGRTRDQAEFIPNDSHNLWRFTVEAMSNPFEREQERPVIFLFTDRGLYRPGETVTFRGIDRILRQGNFEAYQGPYEIEARSAANNYYDNANQEPVIVLLNGESTANGGSYGSFTLPAAADPGQYRLIYRRGRIETAVSFTVAYFERLRFESSLRFSNPVVYQGDTLTASLTASYLSGGGLSGAPYTWHLTREPAGHVPGGAEGMWRNWHFGPELSDGRSFVSQGQGTLNQDGKADISNETGSDGTEGAVYRYRYEASVQDAARQEIAANAAILAHPASFYIAARLDPGTSDKADSANPSAFFLNALNPAALSWALVSPEGTAWRDQHAQEISIQLVRHEWKQARQAGVGGRVNLVWERVEEIIEQSTAKGNSGAYTFTPKTSGLWEIRIQSRDSKQRIAATRFRFYVSGAGWVRWGSDDISAISLTTDRQSYKPGETAKILVRSPLEKGSYLLTLEREGIISRQIIQLEGSALTIDIPIKMSYIPIVYAALSSYTVRSGPPQNSYQEPDLDKPKGIFGVTPIYVDHESRHYHIEITGDKNSYRPAEEAEVHIKVLLNGKAAPNTEVSFMAVDRGVVDLIDYHVPDPASFFYDPRNYPLGVRGADSRSLLIDPVTYSISDLQGGDYDDENKQDDSGGGGKSVSEERRDFRPTAVFSPFLVTGQDGTVTVKFTLPDSLTTYRCTAVAAGLHDFGIKEQDLQVSAPLTAVAALPRKLRWRDTGTVSLILTNLDDAAANASVSLATDAPDAVEVDGEFTKTVKILPGASEEVTFKVAAVGTGEAQLTFTLRSPKVNERIIKTLLVDRPSLTETVTTIGNLSGDTYFAEEGVVLPSLVPEGTGNVTVSLSVSRFAAMKETLAYLVNYPFNCIEQRTAQLLPQIVFKDHLDAFQIRAIHIEDALAEISKYQLSDGSFPYWPGGSRGEIFASLRVAHIMALAKARGLSIPESLDQRQLLYWIGNAEIYSDPFLKGYSLWVRTMYGERIGSEITAFLRTGDELGISGWAFAGLAALEMGQRDLAVSTRDRIRRYIRPGTQTLDLTDTYERRGNYWGYDSDRYALALMLFHALNHDDDQTGLLATSLIARQRQGIWNNTASSFWAVLAIGMSGETDSVNSATDVAVSLGGSALFNTVFPAFSIAPVSYNGSFSETPLLNIARDTLLPLRIERTPQANGAGPSGRLFYTASLRYGIPVELAGARDEGLGVFTETFDSNGQPVTGGRLKPGKTYTRRITVSSPRDRTYVALRAPIPSGAEIVDTVFITSSTSPSAEETGSDYWDYDFYQMPPQRFIMDDEARFHWDFFKAGRQQVEFRFRAVMPGIYPTPPASAECMYEPEIFGRSAGELIRLQ